VAQKGFDATFIMVWMVWRRAFGRHGNVQTLRLQWFGRLGKAWRSSTATYTVVWKTVGGPERLPRYVYNGLDGLEPCFWTAWQGSDVTFTMVWKARRGLEGFKRYAATYTMVWGTLGGPERLLRYVYNGLGGMEMCFWTAW
jgi:hypothetical protein